LVALTNPNRRYPLTRDILKTRWTDLAAKLITLAEEFPAEAYDSRPAEGVRSFAEQLRHIAFWNRYVEQTLLVQPADGDGNELPAKEYATKARIVPALRASFVDVSTLLGGLPKVPEAATADLLLSFIEHNGEHYGQLVLYYRLKRLVPPASRAA
jgi:hypothetical protein